MLIYRGDNKESKYMGIINDLQELYFIFDRINGKKFTQRPLYTMDTTEICEGLLKAIDKKTSTAPISENKVRMMKAHLENDNGLFYYVDGMETPVKVDNHYAISICERLLEQLSRCHTPCEDDELNEL